MTNPLTDKVTIATGGGSGIGEALCLELARPGARVVVADINERGARRVAAAIAEGGGQATAATVDVASEPTRAAQVILDGVARNQALIVFPASIRWAWRALRLFPRLADRRLLDQMRQARQYRTAGLVAARPGAAAAR